MIRKTAMLATMAFVGLTSVAQAEEHTILILPDAFFPEISYVTPGDQIRFINLQEGEANVVSAQSEWSAGPIPAEGEHVVSVSGGMQLAFFDADQVDVDGNFTVQGSLEIGSNDTN